MFRYIISLVTAFATLFTPTSSFGEIQKVRIKWLPGICSEQCGQLLIKEYQKLPGVAQVYMNLPIAEAVLIWKPNVPFSFISVRNAMSMVGVRYRDMHLSVRGTIRKQGSNYFIVSLGDNTPFVLVGPLAAKAGQYVIQYNIASHPLTPYLIQQLDDAITNSRVAVIQGPLFMPEWPPPSYLTIAELSLEVTPPQ